MTEAGLPALKLPMFYPSGVELWAETAGDIIKKAAEEHEECMKNINEAKNRSQVKHIGIGKSSERTNKIPSVISAFSRVTP